MCSKQTNVFVGKSGDEGELTGFREVLELEHIARGEDSEAA